MEKKQTSLIKSTNFILRRNLNQETFDFQKENSLEHDSLYKRFICQITMISRLSEEEERIIGFSVQKDCCKFAIKKLVYHNMRLAIKLAHQYRRSWTNIMDLVQEALVGLTVAAKHWTPESNTRFGTYATYWIKAQLIKFLMFNSRLIHTSNSRIGRKVYFALPKIRRQLGEMGLELTPIFLATELKENVGEVTLAMTRLESKEIMFCDNNSTIVVSNDPNQEIASVNVETEATGYKITKAFESKLSSKKELEIWKDYVIATCPMNLTILARKYGISKQRIGQMAEKLRKSFKKYALDILDIQF